MQDFPIRPKQVRYIKLGGGVDWEDECLLNATMRFGFGTAEPRRFDLCSARRWDDLRRILIDEGKTKGVARNIVNQAREFFEDDGSTLWITFIGEKLYWAFLDQLSAAPHVDGKGVFRKVVGGWSNLDCDAAPIVRDRLPGSISKLVGFRGTSCNVDVAELVVNRINCIEPQEAKCAIDALKALKDSTLVLVRRLNDKDFELLVDLIFSRSGWRRVSKLGGTQKAKDLRVFLPTTNEEALVQVKSATSSVELERYTSILADEGRLFWVYHSGIVKTDNEQVTLIGPEELKELIVEFGLVTWLIEKAEFMGLHKVDPKP